MSDFVARMAARLVGEAALAGPRVPALFERTDDAADASPEPDAQPILAPEPRAAARGAAPPRDEPSSARTVPLQPPPAAGPSAAAASTAPVGQPASELTPRREIGQATLGRRPPERSVNDHPRDPRDHARGVRHRHDETARAREVEAHARPSPHSATPAAPVVRALPAVHTEGETAIPGRPARAETPATTRVHIGRLEVRANVPPPRQNSPPPEPPSPDQLSLSDYLRGKR